MKDNNWKSRFGMVYSTNPDYKYDTGKEAEQETPPKDRQTLHVSLSAKNRGGKIVTLITGFAGNAEDLEALGKFLKIKCGTGGSVKDGEIIIQGDLCLKIKEMLKKEGYKVK
jgi:translation initiation factor 1